MIRPRVRRSAQIRGEEISEEATNPLKKIIGLGLTFWKTCFHRASQICQKSGGTK